MLERGGGFQVARIVALHAVDESAADGRGEIGVLAVDFLAAAPARVAGQIHDRTPIRESAVGGILAIENAGLIGDRGGNRADQVRVPSVRETRGLGEHGRVLVSDAMERFASDIVGADAQPRNGRLPRRHHGDLLGERELGDEVGGADLGRQARVAKIRRTERGAHKTSGQEYSYCQPKGRPVHNQPVNILQLRERFLARRGGNVKVYSTWAS